MFAEVRIGSGGGLATGERLLSIQGRCLCQQRRTAPQVANTHIWAWGGRVVRWRGGRRFSASVSATRWPCDYCDHTCDRSSAGGFGRKCRGTKRQPGSTAPLLHPRAHAAKPQWAGEPRRSSFGAFPAQLDEGRGQRDRLRKQGLVQSFSASRREVAL